MTPDDVRKIAEQVYQNFGSRFGVNQVPTHTHNGIDSPPIPQITQIPNGPGGVLGIQQTAGQVVNLSPVNGQGSPNSYTVAVPIIYGHGVGVDSQFNGGEAAAGTFVMFMNPPLVIQLWWRALDVNGVLKWYGVDVAPGTGNAALALGPL